MAPNSWKRIENWLLLRFFHIFFHHLICKVLLLVLLYLSLSSLRWLQSIFVWFREEHWVIIEWGVHVHKSRQRRRWNALFVKYGQRRDMRLIVSITKSTLSIGCWFRISVPPVCWVSSGSIHRKFQFFFLSFASPSRPLPIFVFLTCHTQLNIDLAFPCGYYFIFIFSYGRFRAREKVQWTNQEDSKSGKRNHANQLPSMVEMVFSS